MIRVSALIKTLPTQHNSDMPFWLKIGVIFGVEMVKDALIGAATATMGPAGTMITEVFGDIAAGVIEDMIIGNNPLSEENILFNFGFPALRMFRKFNTIRRFNGSYLREVASVASKTDKKNLFKLYEDLRKMKYGTLKDNTARNFQEIIKPYEKAGLFKRFALNINEFPEKIKQEEQKMTLLQKRLQQLGRGISIFNRSISFSSAGYATRYFVGRLTRRFKAEVNAYLKKWWKKYGGTVSKVNEFLYKTVIPLRHVGKPWIVGIRIFQVQRLSLLFHIQYVFSPWITNFKKPVWLYNRTMEDVSQILQQPSAGQYYINNISWGWKIGKIIRQSGVLKAGYFLTSSLPVLNSSLSIAARMYHSIHRAKNYCENLKDYQDFDKIIENALIGLQKGIKGERAVRAVSETLITDKSIYIKHYIASKVKRAIYLNKRYRVRGTIKGVYYKNNVRKTNKINS